MRREGSRSHLRLPQLPGMHRLRLLRLRVLPLGLRRVVLGLVGGVLGGGLKEADKLVEVY
eukprot:COSAG05_NODE_2457_length_3038_cov_4.874107_4_plen_60_part_00